MNQRDHDEQPEAAAGEQIGWHLPNYDQPLGLDAPMWVKILVAVRRLDEMQTSDPEAAHGDADDILLELAHPDVAAAYHRLVERCAWWASA